jgi:uncharacterized protein DUF4145
MANKKGLTPKPVDALPDSTEPHGPCPRCGRVSNFSSQGSLPVSYDSNVFAASGGQPKRIDVVRVSSLECNGCKECVVVVEEQYIGGVPVRAGRNRGGVVQWRGIHWWPTPGMQPADPDIPSAVSDAVAEGTRCLAVGAARAAAVMFRGALAEIVTDRGSAAAQAKKSLKAQLEQMATDGDLDKNLADWADHIRLIGNAGAHPNELDPVTLDEATDLSRLINSMLDYLYVMPAKISRARGTAGTPTP